MIVFDKEALKPFIFVCKALLLVLLIVGTTVLLYIADYYQGDTRPSSGFFWFCYFLTRLTICSIPLSHKYNELKQHFPWAKTVYKLWFAHYALMYFILLLPNLVYAFNPEYYKDRENGFKTPCLILFCSLCLFEIVATISVFMVKIVPKEQLLTAGGEPKEYKTIKI